MNHCKTIALVNQKGGVGKTTSTINLGVGLASQGNKVLLVDGDPQHSLTIGLGVTDPDNLEHTLNTAMLAEIEGEPSQWETGIIHHREGVDLLPANDELAGIELRLFSAMSREQVLKSVLSHIKDRYDYILIDGMPSLGIVTVNVLVAADSVIIPSEPDFLSTKGMNLLLKTIGRVRRQINPRLKIDGIVVTKVDSRTNNAKNIIAALRTTLDGSIRVFDTEIPRSVRAAEASGEGKSIFAFDTKSRVAQAYTSLTKEVVESNLQRTTILTWKRTSGDYYDTLIDDCHVFSFGLDLTKLFSDVDAETAAETKLYDSVKFKIQNKTDGTWIIAKRNDAEGVYYVTGHTDKETDATVFTPVTMGKSYGHIIVKGLEEDTYTIIETQTANGYTLLKNAITVTISLKENTANTCNVYTKDVLGVLQNDPHYSFDGGEDLKLANIPQRALSHNYPTASATVDKNEVTMLEDNGSANAEVPLTVKNTKGFDLPKTGDHGTWMYSLVGILMMSAAAGVIVLTARKKHGR